MAKLHGLRAFLPAAALLLGLGLGVAPAGASSVGTTEYTQFLPVWLARSGAADTMALLNVPPAWTSGDAAVVLAPGDWPPGARDRLVAAVLDAGAAVLEMNGIEVGRTLDGETAAALATLRIGFGAGIVVLVGYGPAMTDQWPRAAEGYTAGVAVGSERVLLVRGPTPPEVEAWPVRAPLLCDVLAAGLPPLHAPTKADCRETLLRR